MIFMCCKTNSVGFKTSLAEGLMLSGEEGGAQNPPKEGSFTQAKPTWVQHTIFDCRFARVLGLHI